MERKFHGSESSLYGFFAPGNESAEERKGLESDQARRTDIYHWSCIPKRSRQWASAYLPTLPKATSTEAQVA